MTENRHKIKQNDTKQTPTSQDLKQTKNKQIQGPNAKKHEITIK